MKGPHYQTITASGTTSSGSASVTTIAFTGEVDYIDFDIDALDATADITITTTTTGQTIATTTNTNTNVKKYPRSESTLTYDGTNEVSGGRFRVYGETITVAVTQGGDDKAFTLTFGIERTY